MKMNIRKIIKKQNIILFICVFIFSMIANNAFLQRHYSSDTMCLIYHGYFEYPSYYFLLDGRIISTLVCYLGGILHLPFEVYLFISNLIGIMLLALSITILFRFIINHLEIDNKWVKFLVLLSVYTIIFNHMDIEYLLFPESCVMCAGVLFSILAVITYLNKDKKSITKSFVLLLISTLCYQGLTSIFPALVITLSLLKKENCTEGTFKYYIKEVFKVGIMFALTMLISAILIAIFSGVLQNSSYRIERVKNIPKVAKLLPFYSLYIIIFQTNKLPIYLNIIMIGITSIIIIKYNKNLLFKYLLVIFTAYLFCIVPILGYGYTMARMLMAVGATMGISLLYISVLLKDKEKTKLAEDIKTVIINVLVIGYFTFNVINNYINGYEHLKAFAMDEELGVKISQMIKEYEETSGEEIKKASYYFDKNPTAYGKGIKELGSLSERKFGMPHCVIESISYYCNKKLEEVAFSSKVYYENFYGKDYNEFSEEQIVFVDDTIYIYIY